MICSVTPSLFLSEACAFPHPTLRILNQCPFRPNLSFRWTINNVSYGSDHCEISEHWYTAIHCNTLDSNGSKLRGQERWILQSRLMARGACGSCM